jgi:flagella basal body P-ring formation protein FlgA
MFAFTTIALSLALAQGEPPFTLELRQSVLVRGLAVTIGDLAVVSPPGQDALAVEALRFAPAPVPGYARTVTRSELLQSLVAAGHAAGSFRCTGAVETLVQAVVVEVPAPALIDAAEAVLQALLAEEGGDVEWALAGRLRSVQAAPGRRSQDLKARVRGGATHASSAVVDVEVLVDGEIQKTVPVQFDLVRFQPVLQVTGTVRAGTPLGPENLAVARRKLAQTTGLFLTSFEQVRGQIARRNLQPNQLLTLGDVGAPALIRKGEVVTVVITRGRVKVTTRALANHDAGRGETITVTNAQTRAQITGVAEASGTVVVPTH